MPATAPIVGNLIHCVRTAEPCPEGPASSPHSINEQGHGEKVGAAAGAEIARHEGGMDGFGPNPPSRVADPAGGEEIGSLRLGESQALSSPAMQ
jgi:hypothetical protein